MKTNLRFNTFTFLILFIVLALITSGCAQKEVLDPCLEGQRYGFLHGLWHGFIAPISFIGMLFRDNITMFAENNTGIGYAAGFLLGSGGWGFFGGKTFRSNRKGK